MATKERDLMAVLAEWHTESVADSSPEEPTELTDRTSMAARATMAEALTELGSASLLAHSRHLAAAARELTERIEATTSKARAINVHAALWTGMNLESVEEQFARLVEQWKADTEFESSLTRVVMHNAYQRIIGMGGAAIPLILRELEREPDYWFWALAAITGEDPADDTETIEEASERWLEWGRNQALVA
jgi:hypothetical protein